MALVTRKKKQPGKFGWLDRRSEVAGNHFINMEVVNNDYSRPLLDCWFLVEY